MADLTQARLREVLNYDPETGDFHWRKRLSNRAAAGKKTGLSRHNGYSVIRLDRKLHFAHRLAFLYIHGRWPTADVDHINGVRDDNRICNLREATRAENIRNSHIRSDNKSGFKGVSWNAGAKLWMANIRTKNRTNEFLGLFDTPEEAHEAYAVAAKKYFGQFARIK